MPIKLHTAILNTAARLWASFLAVPVKPRAGEPDGLHRVGVWVGRAAIVNPKRTVCELKALGATDCYVMVNDFSRKRAVTRFSFYGGVQGLADHLNAAGIRVHLTTWVMRHRSFVEQMCADLPVLARACKAVSVLGDLEEPWTQSKGKGTLSPKAAAALIAELWPDDIPLGVTGIGYASTRKLKPFAQLCSYLVPQAYSTRTSKLSCLNVGRRFVKIWASKFGKAEQRVGLAAYRQQGVKGSDGTELDAMLKAIASVPPEVDEVIFWWLPTLRLDSPRRDAVLKLRATIEGAIA